MQEITAAELAGFTGAKLLADSSQPIGPDVVIDSRLATPGCLFVALPGERVDGHDYAAAAIAAGAAAVMVSRELEVDVPQLVVPDTAVGLARVAGGVVAAQLAAGLVSVGVTGSSGKTSTKDLIAQVLAELGPTVAPVGSANNEIGVPLTATKIGAGTSFLVSELGARGQGHIRWLCDIVQPSIGVVVNVGHAHLGEFGSVAAIATAKAELVTELPEHGWAVLNADDDLVAAMAPATRAQLATFSTLGEPRFGELRVWASKISTDARQRPSFVLHVGGVETAEVPVRLQTSGVHQVANALAAAAVALTQSMPVAQVGEALGRAEAKSRWRMELTDAPSGLLVVNDAYNANPDSMAAALRAVAAMRRAGGRVLAVLGDMLELGDQADQAHREVGELAAELGFDELIVIGAHAGHIAEGARSGGLAVTVVEDPALVGDLASTSAREADVVLVKASRGLALETVARRLASQSPMEGEQ